MPKKYLVTVTPLATRDIDEIYGYVVQSSPQNAQMLVDKLGAAIDSLDEMPQRFAIERRGKRPKDTVRRLPVFKYVIYFRIDEEQATVDVVTVRHGSRPRPRKF